jgi:glyoxylase-like metal-dependent hydrolase (beta-lactamase superfamily II)
VRLGALEVLPVLDGAMDVPVEVVLNKVPHPDQLTPAGLLTMQFGGYLVRTGDRVLLVDTGMGAPLGGALLDSLAAYGVQPADVTDVLLTHLHADHIGWVGAFPNAVHRCHAADWQHFVVDGSDEYMRAELGVPLAGERLGPLEARFEVFEGDSSLAPGVLVRHAPGHTPGSTVVVLSGDGETAMLMGDVLHCPAELTSDDWEMMADVDAALARRTREAFARELEGSGVPFAAAHFPGLRFGRLLAGRAWAYA